MNNHRAVFDPKVIDSWSAQIAEHDRGFGRIKTYLLCALALLGAWQFLAPSPTSTLLFFSVAAALVIASFIGKSELTCPNCKKVPFSARLRGDVAETTDICNHCHYWLKSPYSDRDRTQV
ncbi:hypothetical protein [Lysobacter tyrosinilyticus]